MKLNDTIQAAIDGAKAGVFVVRVFVSKLADPFLAKQFFQACLCAVDCRLYCIV